MKIAFLVNRFPAISETFVLNQVVGLLDRGHDVHIIARKHGKDRIQHREVDSYDLESRVRYRPSIPDVFLARLAKLGSLYMRFATHRLKRMPEFIRLAWRNRYNAPFARLYHGLLLLDQLYDVVHCQYGYIANAAVMLREAGLLSSPAVTTFHGYDINVYPGEHGKDCYQRLFKSGDRFTVGSNFARERLIELGPPGTHMGVAHGNLG